LSEYEELICAQYRSKSVGCADCAYLSLAKYYSLNCSVVRGN